MSELLVIEEPQKHFNCTSFSKNRNSFTSHYIKCHYLLISFQYLVVKFEGL